MFDGAKKNEVTITREQFKERAVKALSNGKLINEATEKDPHLGVTMMLMGIPLLKDIEDSIFGEEKEENGTE